MSGRGADGGEDGDEGSYRPRSRIPHSMNGRCTSFGSVGGLHGMVGAHVG